MNNIKIIKKLQEFISEKPYEYQAVSDLFEMARIVESDDFKFAHSLNKNLRRLVPSQVRNTDNDLTVRENFYHLNKRTLLFDAKIDFDAYMQYIEYDREPKKRFYLPRRKQILPIVQSMQDLEDDILDLLSISTPPGVGKTTLGIFFLTMIMGKYPLQPNLASAHSSMLTRSFYDGALSIITDPEYLWEDVFPGTGIVQTNSKEETIDLDKRKRFKTLTCRSIDGSLTGATRCEKYLYADDLVSGIEEALSKPRLDSLWEKYTNDLKSRKKLGCKEIHIATRWSVHDVIGRLERQYEGDPRARFLSYPALNEKDESNFDYLYDVGFDTKYFWDMRDSLDDVSWRCLFQNEPIEREGLLYHDDDLRRYFDLPGAKYSKRGKLLSFNDPDVIIGVCDTKDKGTDYAFLPVAYVYGQDYYIEDCICDNSLPEIVEPRMIELLVRHKVKSCRFESNSAGGRIADEVQKGVKNRGGITHITTKYTTANKETKIIVNSTWVKEHCLFKDSSKYKKTSDYGRMMNFLCMWTMAGKNKYDDVPDGMAMLAEYIQSLKGSKVEVMRRPY